MSNIPKIAAEAQQSSHENSRAGKFMRSWPSIVSFISGLALLIIYAGFYKAFSFIGIKVVTSLLIKLGCIIFGLSALVFGAMAVYQSGFSLRRSHWLAIFGLISGIANLVGFLPLHNYEAERYIYMYGLSEGLMQCELNMRDFGQAIIMYSNDHGGNFPNQLSDLLLIGNINASSFVCPLTNESPAVGSTTQAIAAQLSQGNHISYIYIGRGMTTKSDPKCVVIYEKEINHGPDISFMNFLFADGHIEMVDRHISEKMIHQLQQGVNPPRL